MAIMSKKADKNGNFWCEMNDLQKDLSPAALSAFNAYKAQYAKVAELRNAFEKIMVAEGEKTGLTGPATRLAFSYNFGKLSIAVVAKDGKATSKASTFTGLAGLAAHQAQANA